MRWFLALFLVAATASADDKSLVISIYVDGTAKSFAPVARVAPILEALTPADVGAVYLLHGAADQEKDVTLVTAIEGTPGAVRRAARGLRRMKRWAKRTPDLGVSMNHVTTFLADSYGKDIKVAVILFAGSDGKAATEALAELMGLQIAVHAIALGDSADVASLDTIARSSKGMLYKAADKNDLAAAMGRLVANIVRLRAGQPIVAEEGWARPEASGDTGTTDAATDGEAATGTDGKDAAGTDGEDAAGTDGKEPAPADDGTGEEPATDAAAPSDGEGDDDGRDGDDDGDDEQSADDGEGDGGDDGEPREAEEETPMWVWYAAGGGGLLLIVVIVLLIVLSGRGGGEEEEVEEYEPEPTYDAAAHFGGKTQVPGGGGGGGGGTVAARLVPIAGHDDEITFTPADGVLTVGRKASNDLQLDNRGCSGFHAELRWEDGRLIAIDKGSTNGTFINDVRITEQALNNGDVLRFDAVAFRVGGQIVVERTAAPRVDGQERTAVLSADDPYLKQLQADEPEPTQMLQAEPSVVLDHATCWKHKNRVAHQQCDVCGRPWCSECLERVVGQEVCPRCRAQGYGAQE